MSDLGLNGTQIKRFLGYLKVANTVQLVYLNAAILREQKERRIRYNIKKYEN